MLFRDARDYQIIFLSLFLFLGILTRDWTLRTDLILIALFSCCLTQIILFSLQKNQERLNLAQIFISCKSSLITALGLCLLLRANDYQTMAVASCLAIASKFIFRHREKHFFNPANFGIIAALILTNDAWVSPGQWGTDWWYLILFIATGGLILNKVGRWDTSVAFLVTYACLEALRSVYLGWTWDVWQHQLSNGSLLLFAFFMLTDPRSIPNATITRIIWATSIAFLTFILRDFFYVNTAMFWALFILSPTTIYLDYLFTAPHFNWQKSFKVSFNPSTQGT